MVARTCCRAESRPLFLPFLRVYRVFRVEGTQSRPLFPTGGGLGSLFQPLSTKKGAPFNS